MKFLTHYIIFLMAFAAATAMDNVEPVGKNTNLRGAFSANEDTKEAVVLVNDDADVKQEDEQQRQLNPTKKSAEYKKFECQSKCINDPAVCCNWKDSDKRWCLQDDIGSGNGFNDEISDGQAKFKKVDGSYNQKRCVERSDIGDGTCEYARRDKGFRFYRCGEEP